MPRTLPGLMVAFLIAAFFGSAAATGQDSAPKSTLPTTADSQVESTQSPTGDRIQAVGPDTYILLDSAGRPQQMPGMTYEDFLAAWKKLNQPKAAGDQPSYTIDAIRFTGHTRGQRAELDFEATIRLLADGRTDVPLGLVGAILDGEPRFASDPSADDKPKSAEGVAAKIPNDDYLTYDPDRGGFIAHLAGRAGERRTVSVGLIVPLVHDGAETTLPINCPRALSSQLSLTIDSAISDARATGGAVLSQESTAAGEAVVKVAGPAGLFRLAWQTANQDAPALTSVLHAVGAVRVTIDGRGIRSDARLTVRSYGGGFDQFRVRLPADAQLVQARPEVSGRPDAIYRIRVEPDSAPPANDREARREIAVIELPEKQQGPVIVDLSTEQAGGVEDRGQEVDLAGFDVLGAVRQFGDIALDVADDWQARWTIGSYVRQVDPNELDAALQTPGPTAAFQYDRQPWALKVRVTPRQLRVHVTPNFELECLPEETQLNVRLAYQLFGARAFEFRVDLNGWEITGDPVESGGLVDQDRIEVTPEGTLVLPLVQASLRRAEVAFSLRRAATRDASRLELPLPAPLADSVGTGELTVRSTPDIELLPDLANSKGLVAAPTPPADTTATDDEGTELHFRALLPSAIFVTDRTTRPRDVTTQSTTQIDVGADEAQIDQRINYVVRYEPISELIFEAPDELTSNADELELRLLTANAPNDSPTDELGIPLHINPLDEEYVPLAVPGTQQIRVMLPQSRIGRFAVRIRYRRPLPILGATDVDWSVPLVYPTDGKVTGHEAIVRAPRGLAIALDTSGEEPSWKPASSPGESDKLNSDYTFAADAPELSLPLTIHSGRSDSTAATIVERVWLQTWFSQDVQQDRAAFRFRTASNQVTVELPPDSPMSEFELLVDREPAEVVSRATGRIVVRIPQPVDSVAAGASAATTSHTLELRYRQTYQHKLLARHRLTPPQIEGSTALSQVYWHVVLPGDEHIVHSPQQLAAASQWQWLGTFWGLRPVKSQPQLEAWAGASEQPPPTAAHSEYLFTGLLPVASIEVAAMPRWLIVLAASAVVLALASVWLYMPIARRTWIVAIAAVAIAASAITHPTAALLLAQAAAIGLVLAILSAILARLVARPARPPLAPVVSPSSQQMVTPRSDSILIPSVFSAASTSPHASVRGSDSER